MVCSGVKDSSKCVHDTGQQGSISASKLTIINGATKICVPSQSRDNSEQVVAGVLPDVEAVNPHTTELSVTSQLNEGSNESLAMVIP
ncbi:hypothetical protein V6N12_004699 [Hibiscus sabdariffa]|uniref:Uncharacterized protein n=1 Tax=Hibiscus sabdariffa TaxID=183260 RepID=A0ABR2CM93_9ROSI